MKKTSRAAAVAALLSMVVTGAARASVQTQAAHPTMTSVKEIRLAYKRDPRLVDPYRNPQPWVVGPAYAGATAQDTVEVRVEGLDAGGKSARISPEWIASDPQMVTVSPTQGDHVTIKVNRAGDSKVKLTYQGVQKELAITAKYANDFLLFEIAETVEPKPSMPVASSVSTRKTKNDVSYAVGMNLAHALREQSIPVDVDLLMQGLKDSLSGAKTLMTVDEAMAALNGLQIDQRLVEASQNRNAIAAKNKRDGEAFLATNKAKDGVVSLPSGLQYRIIKAAEGKTPTADDSVVVQYRGTFIDGKEFDNTFQRKAPLSVPVKSLIKGWAEALRLMPVGSRWQLFVPSDLAYGERGAGGGGGRRAGGLRPQRIGPNATLIFDVELVAIGDHPGNPAPESVSTTDQSLGPEGHEAVQRTVAQKQGTAQGGSHP